MIPIGLLDSYVGKRVNILTRGEIELFGILAGFDDYINVVLMKSSQADLNSKVEIELADTVLINGNNIVGISSIC